jgi:hypothetical protein
LIFFSFLWHKIIVLILNMFIYIYIQMYIRRLAIQNSLKCMGSLQMVFYTQHRVNITIYRTVYLHTDVCKR